MTFNLIADRIEVFILKSYKKLTLKRIYPPPPAPKKKMFSLNLKQKRECQGILPKNGRPHHRGVKKTKIVSFEKPKC
jgi:hypothetical protein